MNPRDRQPPLRPQPPGTEEEDASARAETRLGTASAFGMEEDAPDWEPPAGGPSLSASGHMTHPCARCGAPRDSATEPCGQCGALPDAPRAAPARVSPPVPAPVMAPSEDLAEAPAPSAPSVLATPASALELEERAPRPESTWESEPTSGRGPRRNWGGLVVTLGVVAALVAGGVWLWPKLRWEAKRTANGGAAPMLSIQSRPDGATVLVDGVDVGTTPLMMDNIYPDRPIPVQLKLRGYRAWEGTFTGGEPAALDVRLQR